MQYQQQHQQQNMNMYQSQNNCQQYYPPHFVVQRLNDQGASLIEQGQYSKAIDVLVNALELWECVEEKLYSSEQQEDSDNDEGWTIDDCILQQSSSNPQQSVFNRNVRVRRASMEFNMKVQQQYSDFEQEQDNEEEEEDQGFIYSQPIRIPSTENDTQTISRNTISLILILNVAMAYHLTGIGHHNKRYLQKALNLYELSQEILMEAQSTTSLLQATIIITNNVGEIHRVVKNHKKHSMCLKHLLSIMMFMIDNNHTSLIQNNNAQQYWDGFLRNTSTLILNKNCAGAA